MADRGSRRIIWLAVIATVLGAIIWIVSGAPIDAVRLKATLQSSVRRATGRALTIDGPLRVTMGLSPHITAQGVTLANAPGGSSPTMLAAKTFSAQVALLPLLGGYVELEEVALGDADILVESEPDGRSNWQFQPQTHALVPGGEPSARSTRGGDGGLDVHRLRLTNGRVTWRLSPTRVVTADLDDATLDVPRFDAPMQGSAQGRVDGVRVGMTVRSGSFSRLQGGPVTALAGAWPLDFSLTAGNATLTLDGGINHPDEWRGYAFLLTANAPDLAPFAPWLPDWLALPLKDVNLTARLSDGSNGTFRTASVSVHAGAADLNGTVPGLALKEAVLSAPGPGQQAQLSIDGTYQGAPLRLAGTSTQPDILGGNVPVPITFSVQAGPANLSARGTIPPSPSGNGLDLTVDLRVPKLADLAGLARRPLPDIRDLSFAAHVGDAGVRLRGFDLREIVFASSLGDVTGALTLAWAPVLTLNGNLASKQFDMDTALAAWAMLNAPQSAPTQPAVMQPAVMQPAVMQPAGPAATVAPPGAASPSATFISDQTLPFVALRGADGDLTISADRMIFGGEPYRDVQAKMVAAGGRVVVNPLRMTAPQGILVGGLTVDASADPPQLALTFRSPGLAAAKLAGALGYPGGATGVVQMDAQLSGSGSSPHALAATLDGHLGLSLVNGSVSDTVLQNLLGAALSRAGVPSFGGDVAVRCFASRTDFTHGVGQVRLLALDTPQMTLDGTGSVDLGAEKLALHLRPVVRIGGTGVAAPISLYGAFGDLKSALDPVLGGRVGISIGGPAPSESSCAGELGSARGGMPGPLPAASNSPSDKRRKKPVDLLRGLFH